jgi:hypothetical protein
VPDAKPSNDGDAGVRAALYPSSARKIAAIGHCIVVGHWRPSSSVARRRMQHPRYRNAAGGFCSSRSSHRHPQAPAGLDPIEEPGLALIDEEHRLGVRDKEQHKNLRAEADVLTLTGTPIPRAPDIAMSG